MSHQYLVALRHTMDDVPYMLCDSWQEANEVVARASEEAAYDIARRLGIDCSTPIVWVIYEFCCGVPVEMHTIREARDITPPWQSEVVTHEDIAPRPSKKPRKKKAAKKKARRRS